MLEGNVLKMEPLLQVRTGKKRILQLLETVQNLYHYYI